MRKRIAVTKHTAVHPMDKEGRPNRPKAGAAQCLINVLEDEESAYVIHTGLGIKQ